MRAHVETAFCGGCTALLFIAGMAVGLYHFWGWKGLLAFPFLLVGFLCVAKAVGAKLVRGFLMSLFSMKGAVLAGALVEVHSIKSVTEPDGWDEAEEAEEETEEDPDDTAEPETPSARNGDPADEDDEKAEPDAEEELTPPRHCYEIDLTISPTQAKCMRLWDATELELTSAPRKGRMELMEQADDTVADSLECLVWDGSKFAEDGVCKYEGARRLKIVFAVNEGIRTAHLNYYCHPLCPISLPEWTPPATEPATPEL